jgi:hypothetical protein
MAKKSTAARQASATRRSQTASRAPEVTLVRQQPKTAGVDTPPNPPTMKAAASSSTPSSAAPPSKPDGKSSVTTVVGTATRPRIPEVARNSTMAKPAGARPENGTRPTSKVPATRTSRAQSNQRARAVNRVSPEQYSYVKNDLKLIASLAAFMFAIIVGLHFLLPLLLPQ